MQGDKETAMRKKYVTVEVLWDKDGGIRPEAILWENNGVMETYAIDQILSAPRAMPSAAGGVGKRYEVVIRKQHRNLFLEKDKWFIETRE